MAQKVTPTLPHAACARLLTQFDFKPEQICRNVRSVLYYRLSKKGLVPRDASDPSPVSQARALSLIVPKLTDS
jgi:hypothetical protein